ncbi:hypothetical protein P4H61_16270 [Paenibacillus peoriae]|nr:hypothetical protein [Paenibacillus peoriae]MEC0183042.1 hypothetical protein [Paenibacillus peoriae]
MEQFDARIIVAASLAAHTAFHFVFVEPSLVVVGCILVAVV